MRPDFVNLHQQKRMAFIDHDGFHELGKAPHSAGCAVLAFFVNGR